MSTMLHAEDRALVDTLDERIAAWEARVVAEDANVEAKHRKSMAADSAFHRALNARADARAELDRLKAAREALVG